MSDPWSDDARAVEGRAEVEAHSPNASPVLSDLAPLKALVEKWRERKRYDCDDTPTHEQHRIDGWNAGRHVCADELNQLLASLGTGSQT